MAQTLYLDKAQVPAVIRQARTINDLNRLMK